MCHGCLRHELNFHETQDFLFENIHLHSFQVFSFNKLLHCKKVCRIWGKDGVFVLQPLTNILNICKWIISILMQTISSSGKHAWPSSYFPMLFSHYISGSCAFTWCQNNWLRDSWSISWINCRNFFWGIWCVYNNINQFLDTVIPPNSRFLGLRKNRNREFGCL